LRIASAQANQAGETTYAFGPGLDEFADRRFTAAIANSDTDRSFTKFLIARGLMEFFRGRELGLRWSAQGFEVQDHTEIIKSSTKGLLHIIPQYTFQPYWIECTGGDIQYAFAIEPGTTTLSTFQFREGLRSRAKALEDIELVLDQNGCKPGCPLYSRKGQIIGRFRGFAEPHEVLNCTCHDSSFTPTPIRVVNRHRKPGVPRRRRGGRGRNRTDYIETTLVVPGQLMVPAPSQRRLLSLSDDREELERAGKIWLGSLSSDRKIRTNVLQVRYERIQRFLARMVDDPRKPLRFSLPTNLSVQLERMPISVEELLDVNGGAGREQSPYRDDEEGFDG
jgi:hypothetical protein